MKSQVIVDPSVNILYASFYIEGLYKIYGRRNVKFSSKPFVSLSLESRMAAFPFVVIKDGKTTKYIISFYDSYKIIEELYHWCDVYGSVNANFNLTPKQYHPKLVSLAPSFGIRVWGIANTILFAFSNLVKTTRYTRESFSYRKFLGKYKRMYTLRLPYKSYEKSRTIDIKNDYIFFLSTLWYNDEWNKNDEGVNKTRANFIRACKDIKTIDFEGGMVSSKLSQSSNRLFADCLYHKTIAMKTWLYKTCKSFVVFNTPAFWNCHGWKLAEYLALGKAIVSTDLSNDLPAPLINGENIHITDNSQEAIGEAITFIMNNIEYRDKLGNNARRYWEKYGTPVKSLELLGCVGD